jgi:hypothetical protein
MKEGTLQFALGKYLPSCKVGTRLLEGKWKVPSGLQEVGRYLPACLLDGHGRYLADCSRCLPLWQILLKGGLRLEENGEVGGEGIQ